MTEIKRIPFKIEYDRLCLERPEITCGKIETYLKGKLDEKSQAYQDLMMWCWNNKAVNRNLTGENIIEIIKTFEPNFELCKKTEIRFIVETNGTGEIIVYG